MAQTMKLVEDLIKVKKEIGKLPSRLKYKEFGQYHPSTVERCFGSWNKALKEVFGAIIRERPELRPIIQCQKCGKKTKNPKFCSRTCSISFNNVGKARNIISGKFRKKPCKECGKITSNIKFCSVRCTKNNQRKKIEEIIESGKYKTPQGWSDFLKNYVIKKRTYKCEKCNKPKWLGSNIPLNLHHKNGDAMDNNLFNLELLCLNCHGLTSNFGSKNKKSTRVYRYKK